MVLFIITIILFKQRNKKSKVLDRKEDTVLESRMTRAHMQ
jgi:hypothetical protein